MNVKNMVKKIKALDAINYQMAELKRLKEEMEADIINKMGHETVGQKTYTVDKYALTIKTDYTYSLDKKLYAEMDGDGLIDPKFNPVEEKTTFAINRTMLKNAYAYASKDTVTLIEEFVKASPSKPHVKIGAAVGVRT